MEIVFNNVCFKNRLNNISFSIKESGIYSFIGSKNSGVDLIGSIIASVTKPTKGQFKISNNIKIGYVLSNPYEMFKYDSVYKELENILKEYNYKINQIDKRIKDSLKIVDLDLDYLTRNPEYLSLRDAKKVSLLMSLIHNPKVIILNNITEGLTYNDKKELNRLLKMLKNKYNKIIILITKDTTLCYSISDYVYLISESKIINHGKKSILETINLEEINLECPNIISFVNECNKNNHEIKYYDNILDLIKEVYRNIK